VNVVVLAGTVATDPVQRRMPSGDEVSESPKSCPQDIGGLHRVAVVVLAGVRETVGPDSTSGPTCVSPLPGPAPAETKRSWRALG
jgi:hypothetical protein